MSENKRPRVESVENEPLSENKRAREESLEKTENERPREVSVKNDTCEDELPGEESEQNEPLDLSMGRRSPVNIPSDWDVAGRGKAGKKKSKKKSRVQEEDGVTYPIDIWFLISDYIDPESVGKFARICKDALSVTDTAVFWCRLFKRYCQPTNDFSGSLKPGALEERYGLRARVIKALHVVYEPFVLTRRSGLKTHVIENRQVVGEWCERSSKKSYCNYFFELKDTTFKRRLMLEGDKEFLKDIAVNPLEGCIVLKVTCPHRLSLPSLLGYFLEDIIFFKLDNRMLKLKCTFRYVIGNLVQTAKVDIGPALRMCFLDWWHPRYPYRHPLLIHHFQFVQKMKIKQEKE